MPTSLRDLFDLPEAVKMTDFVHQIDGGDDQAQKLKTLRLYQVTPSIERKMESALAKLGGGLRDRKSVFSWVHGSFGSGKSHFMHVLSLLLDDDKLVYTEHSELQAQRKAFYPDVIGRKLFRLHVQCISRQASTLEDIIFGPATEELARRHPERPAPALFETTKVFTAARQLLQDLGDEKFFAAFPSNKAEGDDEWGEIASKWDRKRFESAAANPATSEGRALAGELARTPWLKDVVSQTEFVRLGEGMSALAEHLKQLGYEGVVLFLDELILWLTTQQEDKKKLSEETAKVAALVEHGNHPPVLPFFTFAARQRDLSKMVGSFAIGKDEEIFRDYLKFWDSRFETIELEDKDLPRIIERRVLNPRPGKKAEIDQAFEGYRRTFAKDFRELFGDQGDADDFRRVYPFSPALVETTVALSATLQRDRTALRELTNLLVNYLPDFELGNVVPVGDLFDVIVHGQVSDLGTVQQVYEQARRVYDNDLLPHIRKKAGTDNSQKCQLLREGFDTRLGCSGCPEKTCRTQTRIAKTVLLQGIAPNAPGLKNLTASRVVALNSGTLKSKVPNQEAAIAAGYLREWAALSAAIQVQGDTNPQVRAALDSIDSRRILDANRALDNVQRRRMRVRQILFERLGITEQKNGWRKDVTWSGRSWAVGVVYENVRNATDPTFRPGEDEDLRLIVDYPFDDVGHKPEEDEERLRDVQTRGPAQKTLVWLPAFLSDEVQSTLGDLVILDGLVDLKEDDFGQKVSWVSSEDLARAREVLRQQRGLKEQQVANAIASAYGVTNQFDDKLAPGLRPDRHVHLLIPDAQVSMPPEGDLSRCLEGLLKQALQRIAPRHPPFVESPTKGRLENVLEVIGEIIQSEGQKKRIDAKRLKDVRGIAAVEHLSLVRVVDDEVIFSGGILTEVQKRLVGRGAGGLSAGDVRAALDPDQLMLLSPEIEDFLIAAFAVTSPTPYRFTFHGSPMEPVIGKLANDTALVPVRLPTVQEWERALANAGVLGEPKGVTVLSAARLDALSDKVHARAKLLEEKGLESLTQLLANWGALLGIADIGTSQRGEVLATLRQFVQTLAGKSPYETVLHLAGAPWRPERLTALAYVAGPERIEALVVLLGRDNSRRLVEAGLAQEQGGNATAKELLNRLREAFRRDENIEPLSLALEAAVGGITGLFRVATVPPPVVGREPVREVRTIPESLWSGLAPKAPGVRTETMRVATGGELQTLHDKLQGLLKEGHEVEVQLMIKAPGDKR